MPAGAPYLVRPASPRFYLDFSEKGGERTVQGPGIESLVETSIIFGSTWSIMCECLHFEVAQTSMEIMTASADNMTASVTILGGETNLKCKNSSITEQKHGRFSSPFRAIFVQAFSRTSWQPLWTEVKAFSKGKNSYKKCVKPRSTIGLLLVLANCT